MERAFCSSSPQAATPAVDGGVTLVEALIAIFILGRGLLALLTLFPVAERMADAIKDDRISAFADDAADFSARGLKAIIQLLFLVERQAIVESPL